MNPEQTKPRFATNPDYVSCQRLLKELQELMAAGEGESARADAIRDELETIQSRLEPVESQRIEELSADLYMLTDEEIFQDVSAEEKVTLSQRLAQAFESKRYEAALALLRCGPEGLPREVIAYVRGRCWAELHDYEPAAWFLQYAEKLAPHEPSYAAMALDAVWKAGHRSDAAERARSIIVNPSAHPRALFTAAQMLFRWAELQVRPAAESVYEMVVSAVEQALKKEEALSASERIPSLTLAGRINRALALERLGRETEARDAHTDNIRAYPMSSEVRTLAGLFELRTDERRAAQYFERAVELKTRSVWPYLFLAHQRLVDGQYQEVIDLCRKGIEYAKSYEDLARFHEWSAIARHELGDPDQTVRALFNAAVAFDPLNFRIRRNRDTFEKFAAAQHVGPRPEFEASPTPDSGAAVYALRATVETDQAA